MKKTIFTLIFMMAAMFAASAQSADQVLAKASQKLTSSSSITAKFTGSVSGTLVVSGKKFAMTGGGYGIWYNGRDMYTYSKSAGETSLTTPTQAELLESNPIEIIKSYKNRFNATKVSQSGSKYTIKLTPKTKGGNVKTATLVINTSTSLPSSINITFSNGQSMSINIATITTGKAQPASAFEYPKSKYPGVEVVDLR